MRTLAVAGCAALVLFGAALIVLDVRVALRISEMWTEVMAQRLALWRWGVGCIIAGVLGMVALGFVNALLTARLWFSRQRPSEADE
jgi:hypothetical protein